MKILEKFSGSYDPSDVVFLLERVNEPIVDVRNKERYIQSGRYHYSEMIGPEFSPSIPYLKAFERAVERNGPRLASDVLSLAQYISRTRVGQIFILSLARAGTPIGAILSRLLRKKFGRVVSHFSISLIADRGIDDKALDVVRSLPHATDESLVFVDGWTGKGVISRALKLAIENYNTSRSATVDPTLHVISDLCGSAAAAAGREDYLIPNCLLGANISGLISRSVLNDRSKSKGSFHGCRYYPEYRAYDRSNQFVDVIYELASKFEEVPGIQLDRDLQAEQQRARSAMIEFGDREGCDSDARVKPGLCEATRVLLRRVPERLIVRSRGDDDVQPLLLLASEKGVPWSEDCRLPWRAASIIAKVPL